MSADSRPSFRAYSKKKFQKLLDANITSSIRERIPSNGTVKIFAEKSRNLTNNIIERTGAGAILNKTKSWLPFAPPSNGTASIPKGFFDSLFAPETVNDVYFKVAIMCIWGIAMLCILTTIITMFIPVSTNKKGTMGVKMLFLHIFLCELCYLIYIMLSMINVGLDFQLGSFWCDVAEYC